MHFAPTDVAAKVATKVAVYFLFMHWLGIYLQGISLWVQGHCTVAHPRVALQMVSQETLQRPFLVVI